jgi:hypothetical protein
MKVINNAVMSRLHHLTMSFVKKKYLPDRACALVWYKEIDAIQFARPGERWECGTPARYKAAQCKSSQCLVCLERGNCRTNWKNLRAIFNITIDEVAG